MSLIDVNDKVTLHPKPGFVVKTKILECKDTSRISTKTFINICHDDQVPQPDVAFDPDIVFPLIIENQWEIPIIVSREREATDKKGFPSLVYDCCINTRCFQWCQISKDLRLILIEWCIESIELINSMTLERDYSIPKMLSKGDLTETEITRQELESARTKLRDMEDNVALNVVRDLTENDAMEEDGELPDLFNRENTKNTLIEEVKTKPFSEEVDNRPLAGNAKDRPLIEEVKSKPLIEEIENKPLIEEVKAKASVKENGNQSLKPLSNTSTQRSIDYTLTFKKLNSDGYNLCIIFESKSVQVVEYKVRFSPTDKTIIIKSNNPSYQFLGTLELRVPVSLDVKYVSTIFKCFQNDKKLYIFI
ncbi:conserved hypothetical protein [Lodderomyces elongisporus NRRL YB-4239]|uniref:PIH1 N-terminal domain-containing protein n=1 Tax=Lodderomyces elongisporus (strain ATCC 11503 / CBS 2605 / JCM 1781 / NBRC 1676 / NRRL YB-4239) TaxID=379508 RepID=A5E6J8_LODEL|nr:conserved hypothetical protein [Lodderomyces elongisporus NRRL YB-4239]